MTKKELKVPFSAPINELDTELQNMDVEPIIQIFVLIILCKEFVHLLRMTVFVVNLQELGKSNISS